MGIFIHVEVAARELDAKILLALKAVERGHSVLLGDVIMAARFPFFRAGLFHTKSVSPSVLIVSRHASIRSAGHKITSQDEEGGLIRYDYQRIARARYSSESIAQASAIFCWGASEFETLVQEYPEHESKFHKTGSPRADLWRPMLREYWTGNAHFPPRPFLLVSSNLGLVDTTFEEALSRAIQGEAVDNERGRRYRVAPAWARKFRVLSEFVEAIRFLSKGSPDYDIVLRPHPSEKSTIWALLLDGIPNVYVIRDGAINSWVNESFAVMHNGCTTALEAVVADKKLITYTPSDSDFLNDFDLANDLGTRVRTLQDLKSEVDEAFAADQRSQRQQESPDNLKIVERVIHFPEKGTSADLIADVWHELVEPSRFGPLRLRILRLVLGVLRTFQIQKFWVTKVFSNRPNLLPESDHKFPSLDFEELAGKVNRLQQTLGQEKGVRCSRIGRKTILLEPADLG